MPIKFAFESTFGGTWGTDEKNDIQDRICVRVADFDYSHFKVIDSPSTIRNISEPELFSKSLQYGDILIEKSGGGEKTLVGRAVRFTGDYKAVCSNFVSVLRPKSNQSSRFWTYVLANLYANRGTYPYIKQSTGIQNLGGLFKSMHTPHTHQLDNGPTIAATLRINNHKYSQTAPGRTVAPPAYNRPYRHAICRSTDSPDQPTHLG